MLGHAITQAEPLPQRRLSLIFDDGLRGEVFLDDVLQDYEGMFSPLMEEDYFRQVRVDPELGTVVWPNGVDLCPDVLYSLASGKPIMVDGITVFNAPSTHRTSEAGMIDHG
ncbi:MAG: DUF2442 domain-containing protein [Magnetococcales bacterium]|nr:DUF2442 domain-containing protein [Magnetococcales bacterium]